MLHILLLILKVIGIILAVIVGIILLLAAIFLFVPIRYDISAKCDGSVEGLKAKIKVTWLLHLVRADVFVKGKKVKWQVRAAWFRKQNIKEGTKREEEQKNEAKDMESQEVEKADVKTESNQTASEVLEEKFENDSQPAEINSGESKTKSDNKNETENKKQKNILEKVKTSVRDVCNKIKDLLQKKEKITEFLTEESHVKAFGKLKKELLVLMKKLKPKTIRVKLHFGFEDPCTTGQVLGGLSIIYPFLGDAAEIIPDFEKQVLEGSVYLKGKVGFCHFIWMALKLFICKDIRTSYKDIRNFKL